MRVTTYRTMANSEGIPCLIKEKAQNIPQLTQMLAPGEIAEALNLVYHLKDQIEEYVYMLAYRSERVIGIFEVSHGCMNQCLLTPREIFMNAVLIGATFIVLAHNHPGGALRPSDEDIMITRRIISAGDILNIRVLDHVIVTCNGDYFSFLESGLISSGRKEN